MISPSRLQELPDRIADMVSRKKASIRKNGINERERKRRQSDVETLEFMRRLSFAIAKAPEDFTRWFYAQTNGGVL